MGHLMTSKKSWLYQDTELVSTATKGKARGTAKLGQKQVLESIVEVQFSYFGGKNWLRILWCEIERNEN